MFSLDPEHVFRLQFACRDPKIVAAIIIYIIGKVYKIIKLYLYMLNCTMFKPTTLQKWMR